MEGGIGCIYDWTDPAKTDITSSALRFSVSNFPEYAGITYGIMTIEQENAGTDNQVINTDIDG